MLLFGRKGQLVVQLDIVITSVITGIAGVITVITGVITVITGSVA